MRFLCATGGYSPENFRIFAHATPAPLPGDKGVEISTPLPWSQDSVNVVRQILELAHASQEDGWLNNGDFGDGSKWTVVVSTNRRYDDISYFYSSAMDRVRLIFCANPTEQLGVGDGKTLPENQHRFEAIEYLSRYTGQDLGSGNRANAYQKALDTVLNLTATAEEVTQAVEDFKNAKDDAGSISISEDSLTLYATQEKAVSATITPVGSTDKIVWASSDETIVRMAASAPSAAMAR